MLRVVRTRILRHQAQQLGLHMDPDGFVHVTELLRLPVTTTAGRRLASHSEEDVKRVRGGGGKGEE